jgi:hypothetical protein
MHPNYPYAPVESGTPAPQHLPRDGPMLPPLPLHHPPYAPYNPMGGSQYHVPSAPMYAPWMYAQSQGVPLYPPFYPPAPHVQQVPAAHAGAAEQWDYMRQPMIAPVAAPPCLPVAAPPCLPVAAPPCLPVVAPPRLPVAAPPRLPVAAPPRLPVVATPLRPIAALPRASPVGAHTAVASTGATNTRRTYPNKQIRDGGEYLPLMTVPDTEINQCGSLWLRSPVTG